MNELDFTENIRESFPDTSGCPEVIRVRAFVYLRYFLFFTVQMKLYSLLCQDIDREL